MSGAPRPDDPGRDAPATGDDTLLGLVRSAVAAHDPVPDHVRSAAKAAFDLRDLDASLAALVADSRLLASAMRGLDEGVVLSWEADEGTLSAEIVATGSPAGVAPASGGLRVVGEFGPTPPATVQLTDGAGTRDIAVDRFGRFAIDVHAGAPWQIRWTSVSGRRYLTPPVRL